METHLAVTDYEKLLDRIHTDKTCSTMEKRKYSRHLMKTVQSLYSNTTIIIDTDIQRELILGIKTNQGLRQRRAHFLMSV